ncbi:MAG TPA: ATPase, T2SS/T4P/T4SS family [Gemmatimonadaceae bacterium]|jgi:type II secretory ATPase GspE/PulE/Tfp pilus assembly ATPase PilB-like protein/8-oxo-dGTP pyrophosphatase MutT (NUDIX family)
MSAIALPLQTDALAKRYKLPVANLDLISAHAVALVPERWARRFHVVPLTATEHELIVATADPTDIDCERTLGFATGRHVRFALADSAAIERRIEEVYQGDALTRESEDSRVEVQHLTSNDESAPPSPNDDNSASITGLLDELLAAGIAGRASDIHIEPEEQGIAVRQRVDGVLALARTLPRAVGPALVSRVKIISGLDIADRLRPQDGRARVAISGVAVDLRVSTLPASHGEKVVIRVLDGRSTVPSLDGMGFHVDELERIERLLQSREGLILVTGPTGSGKTTTLYAALRRLKERGVNIVTVEDPIEYRLPGIVQVQVNEKAGLTFATALRSIMRQDPDVVLIGEIRDRETAEIAIQASLTGHLVLSTLHTNDAPSAVTRLIDIGVASYKIATAVKGVLAQRLVRRLCTECSDADQSCENCGGTRFRGRLALVEVLIGTPEFESRVANGDPTERIAEAARAGGMRTLWRSGVEHVAAGRTTVEEVRRVATESEGERMSNQAVLPGAKGASNALNLDAFDLRDDLDAVVARRRTRRHSFHAMTSIEVRTIDVIVIRPLRDGWRVLALRRAADTRCPGAWEPVHGHIEPGEEPHDAAIRELREETGLVAERLYVVRVQPFYLRKVRAVEMAIVFAAFVHEPADVTTAIEHDAHEWVTVDAALARYGFPGERASLREAVELLSSGDAGTVDDVMRVI